MSNANGEQRQTRKCSKCGKPGHWARDCGPGARTTPVALRSSTVTGVEGHVPMNDAAERLGLHPESTRKLADKAGAVLRVVGTKSDRPRTYVKVAWIEWVLSERARMAAEEAEAARKKAEVPAKPTKPTVAPATVAVPLGDDLRTKTHIEATVRRIVESTAELRAFRFEKVRETILAELREELRKIVREELDALTAPQVPQ